MGMMLTLCLLWAGSTDARVGILSGEVFPQTGDLVSALRLNTDPYFSLAPTFMGLPGDSLTRDIIEERGTSVVLPFMREHNLKYLVQIQYLNMRSQILFQVWKNDGQISNIFVPNNPSVLAALADIAAGGILSMIERLDAGLTAAKRY